MPIKSKEQVKTSFRKLWSIFTNDNKHLMSEMIEDHILSLRHDLLQGLLEEVEKRNKDITAIEYAENINPEEYRMMYHEQTLRLGYNQALSDISSRLRELLSDK